MVTCTMANSKSIIDELVEFSSQIPLPKSPISKRDTHSYASIDVEIAERRDSVERSFRKNPFEQEILYEWSFDVADDPLEAKDDLREASNTLNNSGTEERNAATDALAPLVKASSKPLLHSHFDGLFRFDCLLIAPDNKFINSFLLPLAYGVPNGVYLVFAVLYSKALLVYLLGLAMGHESSIFELATLTDHFDQLEVMQ